MATRSWTTAANGNWSVAGKWNGSAVPTSADTALIDTTGGAYTVTFNTSTTIGALTLNSSNATLQWQTTTARTMTVLGAATVQAGVLDLATTTKSGSTLSAASLAVSGGTFLNNNTVTVSGLADFTGGTETLGGTAAAGGVVNAGTLHVAGSTFTIAGGTKGSTVTSTTGQIVIGSGTVSLTSTGGGLATLDGTAAGIEVDGTVTGVGTIKGALSNVGGTGVVEAAGGLLDLTSNIIASVGISFQITNNASSVLEVDGSVGASNTFSFLGSSGEFLYNNAGSLTDTINGMNVGASGAQTNFIDYKNHTVTITSGNAFSGTTGAVTLSDGSSLTLTNVTNASGTWFVDAVSDGGSGTNLFLSDTVCFGAGTRILTADGDVAVEDLSEGDMVVTLDGDQRVTRPVAWIGHRRLDLAAHPHPVLAAPIRIRRGAFGENLPVRDLVVSPDHCMFIDGKLIPAKLLINDMTIVQERAPRVVHYYHVELDRHSVVLAEGLPTESYLDTGNRAYFTNSGLALVLHPEFHVNAGLKCWEADACAPLAVSASAVEPVWQDLAARAEALGYTRPDVVTTGDADLRIVANGRTFRAVAVQGDRHVFVLPAGASSVRLASRAAIPSDSTPYLDDWRRLGVAVKRIVVRSGDDMMDIPADHPALTDGWYKPEHDSATLWRWMDGDARLPVVTAREPMTVEVHVGITGAYRLDEATAERAAA